MTGRFCVSLRRVPPGCPVCGAPRTVRTAAYAGTVITGSCDPYRCRIARRLTLAGGKPVRFEPQPVDDRRVVRHR